VLMRRFATANAAEARYRGDDVQPTLGRWPVNLDSTFPAFRSISCSAARTGFRAPTGSFFNATNALKRQVPTRWNGRWSACCSRILADVLAELRLQITCAMQDADDARARRIESHRSVRCVDGNPED
jgi:hypothetical protein